MFEQSTQKFSLAESRDLCSFIKTMTCTTSAIFQFVIVVWKWNMLVWIALQAWEFLESYHSFNSHHLEIVEYPPQYNSTLCLQFFCRTHRVPTYPWYFPSPSPSTWTGKRFLFSKPDLPYSGLRDPSTHIFSESWWCQLSKFGWKYKYKDKYRDKYKDRDK